jgi:hypothetical protein
VPLVTFDHPFRGAVSAPIGIPADLYASDKAHVDHPMGLRGTQRGNRLPGCNIRVRVSTHRSSRP